MQARPYQDQVVTAVESGWAEFDRQLVVVPTGGGKTIIFAILASRNPGRTLILAHREELIDQAIAKLRAAVGIAAEKEKAEFRASREARVVVASVQSMVRRLDQWPEDHFSLVVCDEAHHCISQQWQTVLNHFDKHAKVLGVTATPDRGDQRNLGSYFQNVASEVGLFDLIHQGFLSRIAIKAIPLKIDLSGVRSVAGDFADADLGEALEPYLDRIAAEIKEHASFRRVLCFLPLIATSQKFVEACGKVGLAACHVDGNSPDRREILERFARWEFDVLSNAMLLTEGFDDPGIDCVVILRPTRSRPLYSQMVGRGTRVASGKDQLLLLDFLWAHQRHSLVRPAHLIAKTEEQAETMTKLAEEEAEQDRDTGRGQQELDLEGLATEAQAKREAALRKQLAENRNKRAAVISAEEFALQFHQPDLIDYQPVMAWERQAVTDKQANVLKRAKIDLATVNGKGHASKLIDVVFRNRPLQMASPNAIALMHRMRSVAARCGIEDPDRATAQQAGRFFAALKEKKAA